jgi:membrane protein implicated in regulation of membrane protease activity
MKKIDNNTLVKRFMEVVMEILNFSPWVFWASLAVILFILEIFIPGFWIATFGFGAIASAVVSLFTDSLHVMLIVFSLATAAAFFLLRPFMIKYFYKNSDKIETNINALRGRKVIVIETIDNIRSKGRVKIGGELWRARTEHDEIIEKDETVEIIKVDGAKVFVKHFKGE